jgi:flavin-dependent dehydrogenase
MGDGTLGDGTSQRDSDAVVIGGGMGGRAACLHLARAGMKVTCVEPKTEIGQPVGESLDWSSPELLKALGLPMEQLVSTSVATWKRHVTLKMPSGEPEHYVPVPWLARQPFNVELRTIHVDRTRLDRELMDAVIRSGVNVVHEKVARIESTGKRIDAIQTESGQRYSAKWFVDASGLGSSLFARHFGLRAIQSGPAKAAMWTYFTVDESLEGTTLYMEPRAGEYLNWVWEIPVQPDVVSVGYVITGSAMKARREAGESVETIFRNQLEKFPRFVELLAKRPLGEVNVTSFRARTYIGTAGPNWLIVGEAASMVDPITSNGVTAALRHAAEGCALILRYRESGRLPLRARICYSARVVYMGKFFNGGIEKLVYEPPVRNRIGLRHAGTVYISPAWGMNLVYARTSPRGMFMTALFGLWLLFFRVTTWIVYRVCKLLPKSADATGC